MNALSCSPKDTFTVEISGVNGIYYFDEGSNETVSNINIYRQDNDRYSTFQSLFNKFLGKQSSTNQINQQKNIVESNKCDYTTQNKNYVKRKKHNLEKIKSSRKNFTANFKSDGILNVCNAKESNKKFPNSNLYSKSLSEKSGHKCKNNAFNGKKTAERNVSNTFFFKKLYINQQCNLPAEEKPNTCRVCVKSFSTKRSLNLHYRVHSGKAPYTYDMSGTNLSKIDNCNTNFLVHKEKSLHTCNVCNKSFGRKKNLTQHYFVHSGNKPKTTDEQSGSFTSTEDKPYMCNVCAKSFSSKWRVSQHYKVHGEMKPFKSNVYKKSFTRTKDKYHTCKVCVKSFKSNYNLIRHFRIHSGEKPYVCNVCDEKFFRLEKLKLHFLLHTGV